VLPAVFHIHQESGRGATAAIEVLVVASDSPVLRTRSNGSVAAWPDVLDRELDLRRR
jgi:hypothetical protein